MVRIHLGQPFCGLSALGGDVAQLVEHLLCKQEVVGSSPVVSTSSERLLWIAGRRIADQERERWKRTRRVRFERELTVRVDVLFDK